MSIEEAQQLKSTILGDGSWRAANTIDNLLLSAWSVNGAQCNEYEQPLYINTWSVEGEYDGSNFKVPFFEYWIGDGESLAANEFTATMNNVEAGVYDVTALVRVRIKNGAEAPAAGITLQANDAEAVDACDGAQVGESQFYLKKVETKATVAEDGVLTIKFAVAADNNVSWLSFRDVTFTMDVQATADAEKAAQMAAANEQVNDAKEALEEAINAAKAVYNTGDVRYPSAVAIIEAINEAQALLDATGELTKLTQLNSTLSALNAAADDVNEAAQAGEDDMMVDHVVYYWPKDAESANEITLAEGVTVAITGNTSKKVSNGNDITIYGKKYRSMKVSNGAENTLTTSKKVKSITFYSYINADPTVEAYWKEVAGISYTADANGGLMQSYKNGAKPDARYYVLDEPSKTVTFTNAGKQLCYIMDVEYVDETVGIDELTDGRRFAGEAIYNLAGQRVEQPVKGGLYIIGGRKVVVK